MKDKLKECLMIPIYYWEDEDGNAIIDTKEMKKIFELRLKNLYLETKLGKREFYKKLLKNGKK